MDNVLIRSLSRVQWLLIAILLPNLAIAQECPNGLEINKVRSAVREFQAKDRAPAGADCAYKHALTINLASSNLDKDMLDFFDAAAQVMRKAADKRRREKKTDDVDKYLDQEIEIHKIFLKASDSASEGDVLKAAKQHVSDMADALALRRQYKEVAEHLGNYSTRMIDMKAYRVWLQAVWSCEQWDGKKGNVCSDANREPCKEKIQIFLDSFKQTNISGPLPPQTEADIDRLKGLSCLK